jgi:hypothetical protein
MERRGPVAEQRIEPGWTERERVMRQRKGARIAGLIRAAWLTGAIAVAVGAADAQQGVTLKEPDTIQPGPKGGGVNGIWAYAGTWKTEMEHVDTPYSKADKESSTLVNDCWKSGAYVACRQIVNGDPKVLIVFTCKDDHNCVSYQIPPDGGSAGSGKVLLDGVTWTFPWSVTENGKTTYFRVVNVWTTASSIEFRQEYSTDQEHWTRMASGHEEKVPGK